MRTIILNDLSETFIDDEDWSKVEGFNWKKHTEGYAHTILRGPSGIVNLYMHEQILPCRPGFVTDHIDGNRLNNQKSNLREVTNSQNMFNRGKPRHNSSGYKGVYYSNSKRRFIAQIWVNRKRKIIGSFLSATEAAEAYNKTAKELVGDCAKLNPI